MYTELALYIDGKWLNGEGRKGEDVINPATGKALASCRTPARPISMPRSPPPHKGFAVWKATSAYDRSKIMRKAADLLRERYDHVSKVQTQEQGKVYGESRAEVLTSADIIDWYAEEGRRAYGRIVPGRQKGVRQIVMQEPVGVVAAFTPWNFPTLTPVRKIAGALAAGCSIIIKASEETPGGCVELVKCFADAGLPAGVLNLVFGVPAKVSEHLIPSDIVKKISFTGSIPVGKHLAGLAAKGMKSATMELGGHSPVVVFADADPEKAADTIAAFKYRNAGQVCISPTRFYVQESVLQQVRRPLHRIRQGPQARRRPGKGHHHGAARQSAPARCHGELRQRRQGARRQDRDRRLAPRQPGLLLPADGDHRRARRSKIMTEEPFGPMAPIVPFKTFDEVVERANSLPFGLAAYAFTSSGATATAIGDAIQSGMVGVNSIAISTPETPFGGVKESGYGSEGGIEGLQAYMNTKFISQG